MALEADSIHYCVISTRHIPTEKLRAMASGVVPAGLMRAPGKSEARYLSYLAGRAALATIFDALGVRATVEPEVTYGYLSVRSSSGNCFANISHTDDVAVGVVGPSTIGIDIESAARSASRAIVKAASDEERVLLPKSVSAHGGKMIPGEIALWSAKEAVSKATGLGIKFGLTVFEVDMVTKAPHPVKICVESPLHLHDPAVKFLSFEDYVISLCTERKLLEGAIHRVEFEELDG